MRAFAITGEGSAAISAIELSTPRRAGREVLLKMERGKEISRAR